MAKEIAPHFLEVIILFIHRISLAQAKFVEILIYDALFICDIKFIQGIMLKDIEILEFIGDMLLFFFEELFCILVNYNVGKDISF